MTNGEKILTGIVIIAAIITIIIVITNNNAKNKIENQKNEIDNIEDYLNDVDEENISNNSTDNELNEEVNKNEIKNEINNISDNNVIGKEEQESNSQNTELNNEKKAIQLAQKEWGLSINAYNFEAKLQDNGNYKVTVRGKSGNLEEIVTYMVDVKKGIVEDITD